MSVEPPASDTLVGMLVYATKGRPTGARLRVKEDDFQVEELIDLERFADGPYPLYRVQKRGIDTLHAAAMLERALKSRVSFAGLKDKRASAVQYMSPTSKRSLAPPEVGDVGLMASLVGRFSSPVTRGMLIGNRFRVLLKNSAPGIVESVEEAYRCSESRKIPNFFGYQRFGLRGARNHLVGRAIVKAKFEEAVSLVIGEPRIGEAEVTAEARGLFRQGNYGLAVDLFSRDQDVEKKMLRHLIARRGDFLGALRALRPTLRRLFVNAYQAYIFNRTLSFALKEGINIAHVERGDNWASLSQDQLQVGRPHGVKEVSVEGALPLVQVVGYSFRDYGSRFDRLIVRELKAEGLEPRQFYVKEAEEMSAEGGFRHAPLIVRNLGWQVMADGLLLSFSLSKGEYATTLLREIIKPESPLQSGF